MSHEVAQLTEFQAVNNFMYFAHNFTSEQRDAVIEATEVPDHLRDKWEGYCKMPSLRGGTDIFLYWFMELDSTNKELVVNWINENYTGGLR
jgi:hypothetical protein